MSVAVPAACGPDGGVAELAALVRASAATDSAREVVWLRFSALPPELHRPHHLRLLREAVAPRRGVASRLFHLPNGDLAVVAMPSRDPAAGAAALARAALEGALDADALARVMRPLRLPGEAAAVLAAAEDSMGLRGAAAPDAPAAAALDPALLAQAERALEGADVWPLHARQTVCRLAPAGGAPEPVREDVRPLPDAVADRLLGGRAAAAAPALAARLADALSDRLLLSLARPDWLGAPAPLHLPVSVAGLTGAAFLRLDALLPRALKPLLTLGVAASGILDDPEGFRFARDLALARGYRLSLEVPGIAALRHLSPRRLGLDAVRLPFSADLAADPGPLPAVLRDGAEVVLAASDGSAAVAWGWENGITLFQGRAMQRRRG